MVDITKMPNKVGNIFLELTDQCNLSCRHCIAKLGHNVVNGSNNKYGKIEYTNLANEVISVNPNHIYFHGLGESTHSRYFTTLARLFIESGIPTSILNNNFAKRFSEEEIEIFSNFKSIRISLDASEYYLSKEIRGGLNINTLISNMVKVNIKARLLGNRQYIAASCVLSNLNVNDIENIYYLARELGIQTIDFMPIILYGRNDIYTNKNRLMLELTMMNEKLKEELVYRLNKVKLLGESDNIAINIYGYKSIEDLFYSSGKRLKKTNEQNKFFSCYAPWSDIFIDCNGNMYNCCHHLHLDNCIIGNVFKTSLLDNLNSDYMCSIRRKFIEGKMMPKCNVLCPQVIFEDSSEQFKKKLVQNYF